MHPSSVRQPSVGLGLYRGVTFRCKLVQLVGRWHPSFQEFGWISEQRCENMWLMCWCCISLQDMATQHRCQMGARPSASCTLSSGSPSPSSSSRLWCRGSWSSVRGAPSCTCTHAGACRSHWLLPSTPPYWPSSSLPASSSSLLPSSRPWRETGTSWSRSTSASSP